MTVEPESGREGDLSDKSLPELRRLAFSRDGTPEQFQEIHRAVMKTSPNYFNMARPIRMNGVLHLD